MNPAGSGTCPLCQTVVATDALEAHVNQCLDAHSVRNYIILKPSSHNANGFMDGATLIDFILQKPAPVASPIVPPVRQANLLEGSLVDIGAPTTPTPKQST